MLETSRTVEIFELDATRQGAINRGEYFEGNRRGGVSTTPTWMTTGQTLVEMACLALNVERFRLTEAV